MTNINLFENIEYKTSQFQDDSFVSGLNSFLNEIWNKREKNAEIEKIYGEASNKQAFLSIRRSLENKNEIILKSKNYVGVIKYKDVTINLLPKVFYNPSDKTDNQSSNILEPIQNHILWWLSYSSNIKFPNYKSNVGDKKSDFFEALIYMFSKHTKEVFSSSLYQCFEDIERETKYVKGKILIKEYIVDNFTKGKNHIINCRYNSLEIDNKFNRIVKFVCKVLLNHTQITESQRCLREIIFILDEVEDLHFNSNDCNSIVFNTFYGNMQTILDYCKLFLSGSVIMNHNKSLDVYTYLIRSEQLFQNFVYEFIKEEVPRFTRAKKSTDRLVLKIINAEKKPEYTEEYKINPDGYLKDKITGECFITDTKYKDLLSDKIQQTDIYQMVSYAIRLKENKIRIMYPSYRGEKTTQYPKSMLVQDEFTGSDESEKINIIIKNLYLPIIYKDWENNKRYLGTIKSDFNDLKIELKEYIEDNIIND